MNDARFLVFRRGIFYEGGDAQLWAITPPPMVTPAKCDFLPVVSRRTLVFREDLFDPLTRIRRGRLYSCLGCRGDRPRWSASRVTNGLYGPLVGIATDNFNEEDRCEIDHVRERAVMLSAPEEQG